MRWPYVNHGHRHVKFGSDPVTSSPVVWGLYAASLTLNTAGADLVELEGTLTDGTEMFDYSAGSDQPVPLTSGVYSLAAMVIADPVAPDATKFFQGTLTKSGTLWQVGNISPLLSVIAVLVEPQLSVEAVWPLTTSEIIEYAVTQTMNASVDYSCLLHVAQLS